MDMIRYQCVTEVSPPAPFVSVLFYNPITNQASGAIPAQLDSAADRAVVPRRLVQELQLVSARQILIGGLGGEVHSLDEFVVRIQVHDLQPIAINAVAHDTESYVLLGRDVLNQLRIVLDGPKQVLEIG